MSTFKPKLIYVYDALCPWCYAFTPVVTALVRHYDRRLDHEVLSGGMVRGDQVRVIGGAEEAERLRASYRAIESVSGVRFGEAFFAAVASQRRKLDSEPPAIAMAAYRLLAPGRSELEMAHALLRANFRDGGDPVSPACYRRIAEELGLNPDALLATMQTDAARDGALYDFALARQLGADSFPRLYVQVREDYLYLVAKGYTPLERLRTVIDSVLK